MTAPLGTSPIHRIEIGNIPLIPPVDRVEIGNVPLISPVDRIELSVPITQIVDRIGLSVPITDTIAPASPPSIRPEIEEAPPLLSPYTHKRGENLNFHDLLLAFLVLLYATGELVYQRNTGNGRNDLGYAWKEFKQITKALSGRAKEPVDESHGTAYDEMVQRMRQAHDAEPPFFVRLLLRPQLARVYPNKEELP